MAATMTIMERTDPAEIASGWYPDPQRQHNLRYHDGRDWTEHVTHFGPVPCPGCGLHA